MVVVTQSRILFDLPEYGITPERCACESLWISTVTIGPIVRVIFVAPRWRFRCDCELDASSRREQKEATKDID